MNFMKDLHVFWGVPVRKKLKFLNKGGIHSISRSLWDTFIVCAGSSLVEMTGDDNSAADAVS